MPAIETQKKIKRIVFLFIHLHRGGMQRAVSNISKSLPDHFEQYILYFGTEQPGFSYKGKEINLEVPGSEHVGFWAKGKNFLRRRRKLQEFVADHDIDTVVSFGEAANILNMVSRVPHKILSVRTVIGKSLPGMYGAMYILLIKLLYRYARTVIAVSHAIKDDLVENYGVKEKCVQVVYNLYDLEEISRLSRLPLDTGIAAISSGPTVLAVGSLHPLKGLDHLIRSVSYARKHISQLQLLLVGEGGGKSFLQRLVNDLDLQNSVHFLGFQDNPYNLMRCSSVYVLCSHLEGFPNVLLEAMICGMPVISTDCETGPKEILGNSAFGILVQNIDRENESRIEMEIADWIVKLIDSDLGQHYGQLSEQRCRDFSKEIISGQWQKILE